MSLNCDRRVVTATESLRGWHQRYPLLRRRSTLESAAQSPAQVIFCLSGVIENGGKSPTDVWFAIAC
jgi:hypothetical protein